MYHHSDGVGRIEAASEIDIFYSMITGVSRRTPPETCRLAECVGETRSLLRKILAESKCQVANNRRHPAADKSVFLTLMERIVDQCHQTFVSSFHAFYPTASLKWMCLCDLLNWTEPVSSVHML